MMAQSLQVNPIDLKLALISYLLSLAIFIPISGWLADKYGIKRIFIIALIIFTTSSILCGYSTTIYQLIVARFLQGLGGSLMLPIGRLIIIRMWPRHELLNKMSMVVMIGALGLMLGPFWEESLLPILLGPGCSGLIFHLAYSPLFVPHIYCL